MFIRVVVLCFLSALSSLKATAARAAEGDLASASASISSLLSEELSKRFTSARIEFTAPIAYQVAEGKLGPVTAVRLLSANSRGEAKALVDYKDELGITRTIEANANFAAWVDAPVAARRILPGEKLSPESYRIQRINTAQGQAYEFRGVIVPASQDLTRVEARQTILEGQYLLSTALQRIPDVRRGDLVRVELNSGGVAISSQATAQEPGYLDQPVRVLTAKTKRELVGELKAGNVVEVKL